MGKIKIAQVITRLDWGGSPDIVRIICSRLNPEIYDITLVSGPTRYFSAKTREFINRFGNKIVINQHLKRDISPVNDLLALLKLYFLFRREKFDIVHTHTAKAGVLGRLAAYLAGKSIIVHTPHGHNFYGYFGPLLSKMIIVIERLIAHITDRIVALTDLEKNDFLKFQVTDSKKINVIYQGLELDRYMQLDVDKYKIKKQFNISPDENIVGMISRLEPVKGPEYFIKAAIEVAEKNNQTRFMLVGEGSLHSKLEEEVEALGLKNNFIFTGWREDIPEILSIFDILVLPSLNEAVGIVLIEAGAMGIPVIATNVGGIPEIVKANQTGILVSACDSKELAQAINYLLSDKQKRLSMGEAGKVWVRDKFKAEDMLSFLSQLYQELIKSRNYA